MEIRNGVKSFYAETRNDWRKWLHNNHAKEKSVWLIIFKVQSGIRSINYNDAVDEALCYGWIDSKPNKRDDKSYYQFFSQRNPKSNWSRKNKEKVKRLIKNKLMQPAGYRAIEFAKANGTWSALDEVENFILPEDMMLLFNKNANALRNWEYFPPSIKKGILEWILNAKRSDTRKKRIEQTVKLAVENKRANQFKK